MSDKIPMSAKGSSPENPSSPSGPGIRDPDLDLILFAVLLSVVNPSPLKGDSIVDSRYYRHSMPQCPLALA